MDHGGNCGTDRTNKLGQQTLSNNYPSPIHSRAYDLFLTQPDYEQQVGYIVYEAGGEILRHSHRPAIREIIGTPEVLVVKQGRCLIDIYDDEQTLVKTSELMEGDIMLMIGGGHGFRILEDTVFLEVKQGPYLGDDEKILF